MICEGNCCSWGVSAAAGLRGCAGERGGRHPPVAWSDLCGSNVWVGALCCGRDALSCECWGGVEGWEVGVCVCC